MEITRKAILIGSSEVSPELPGVESDMKRYYDFLISNNGGAWEEDEILVSLNEKKQYIFQKLNSLTDIDFAFILIAGHGEFQIYNNDFNDSRTGTYYYITETDIILLNRLFPQVLRSLIIVDVCRENIYINEQKSQKDSRIFNLSGKNINRLHREDYRALYDEQIRKCPQARTILYSCKPDQTAGDNGDGGFFSKALLKSYRNDGLGDIISCKEAFDYAKTYVYENHYPQLPIMYGGRGRIFFPFALS